jgi:hypothetical protein
MVEPWQVALERFCEYLQLFEGEGVPFVVAVFYFEWYSFVITPTLSSMSRMKPRFEAPEAAGGSLGLFCK